MDTIHWIVHGASLPQLLAGMGCARCNITVSLASPPLHLDCMIQESPAELLKHTNSQANLQKLSQANLQKLSQAKPKLGSEPPTQYWTCKPSGPYITLISCPATCCNSWVKTRSLSLHIKKKHGKCEQLLAGRGCHRCNKIGPVASLHLHVQRCMNRRPPKPAQARAQIRAQARAKHEDSYQQFLLSL